MSMTDIREFGMFNFTSDTLPGLSKLIEECGEVIQVAGKLIATNGSPVHWADSDLYQRLGEELGDLMAAISFIVGTAEQLDMAAIMERSMLKLAKFEKWHDGE